MIRKCLFYFMVVNIFYFFYIFFNTAMYVVDSNLLVVALVVCSLLFMAMFMWYRYRPNAVIAMQILIYIACITYGNQILQKNQDQVISRIADVDYSQIVEMNDQSVASEKKEMILDISAFKTAYTELKEAPGKTIYTSLETYLESDIDEKDDYQSMDIKFMGTVKNLKTSKANILKDPTALVLHYSDVSGNNASDFYYLVEMDVPKSTVTIQTFPKISKMKLACNDSTTKLMYAAAIGDAQCLIDTIQKQTGSKIHYVLDISLPGMIDTVEKLDGVNVKSKDSEHLLNKDNVQDWIRSSKSPEHLNTLMSGIVNRIKDHMITQYYFDVIGFVNRDIHTNITLNQISSLLTNFQKLMSIKVKNVPLEGYVECSYNRSINRNWCTYINNNSQ